MALKLSSFLESNNKVGNTVIVDGSPTFLTEISQQLLPTDYNDDHIQGIILLSCIKLLFREGSQEITKKVFACSTFQDRLETFLKAAAERSEYSIDYGRKMITGLMNRIKISLNATNLSYPVLKNPLTFVKASESSLGGIGDDYGLKKYVDGDVKINVVKGDHLTILSNPDLIDILKSSV